MKQEIYLCIHGHFYQPPRENAWTEEIDLQSSAYPFHDWNERINHECYSPNSMSRVIDQDGFIIDIVNNYENINFNFGPTLLSWIEKEDIETYKRIIEADKISIKNHNGHGNAIAQVYNHIIMPLANKRDKVTQLKWGIADFKKHFSREPESIWLSETACNEETLEVLIDHKIKYIILAPHQADKFKKFEDKEWVDVSNGQINPKIPYRCFLKNNPNKFIDIFFYDGPISKAVSFENLLFDAKLYLNKIESAIDKSTENPQLISVATDGETYGHHKAFGERVLAYLLCVETKKKKYKVVNYAEYLELYPPKFEVKLIEGENEEGTSWSCSHGVRRWRDHCGCRGDGPPEWNQHWRAPLRKALDYLRDELALIFEDFGKIYFEDVWEVRNNYVEVILNRSQENARAFLKTHSKKRLSESEIIICLKLLEMQRNALLMYTSCAWFFTEISGIETVQVIQYAARAIELAKEINLYFGKDFSKTESEFLDILVEAKSNLSEFKDGKFIYENMILPVKVTLENAAAHYAIYSIFEEDKDTFETSSFTVEVTYKRKEDYGSLGLNFGRITIKSKLILEKRDLIFVVLQFGVYDLRCSIKNYSDLSNYDEVEKDLFDGLYTYHVVDLLRKIDDYFGKDYFTLKNLFLEERTEIINSLTKESVEKIELLYENAYEENRRVNEIYNSVDLPIPQEISFITELVFNKRLKLVFKELSEYGFDLKKASPLFKMFDMAKASNIKLKIQEINTHLSEELTNRIYSLNSTLNREIINECLNILKIAKKINMELNLGKAQVYLFNLLKSLHEIDADADIIINLNKLAKSLYINFDYKSILKKNIKPFKNIESIL